jgi:hypothetical protein
VTVYHHDWAESGEAGMLEDFGIGKDALDGAEVLVASYTYEHYSGDAYVLFKRDGKLWEVHGWHCSCYGLSESDYSGCTTTQWQPEETTAQAILYRLDNGAWGEEGKVSALTRDAVVATMGGAL